MANECKFFTSRKCSDVAKLHSYAPSANKKMSHCHRLTFKLMGHGSSQSSQSHDTLLQYQIRYLPQ